MKLVLGGVRGGAIRLGWTLLVRYASLLLQFGCVSLLAATFKADVRDQETFGAASTVVRRTLAIGTHGQKIKKKRKKPFYYLLLIF